MRADAFADLFRTLADTGCVHLTAMCGAEEADGQPAGGRDSDPAPAGGAPAAGFGFAVRPLPCGPADTVVSLRRPVALNVYLDAATLAQLNDLPGEIAGYGAITADTARALAASADTIRTILTRPVPGDRVTDRPPGSETDHTERHPAHPTRHGPVAGAAHRGNRRIETERTDDDATDGQADGRTTGGSDASDVRRRACGTILDAGRAVYRPPDATADYVTARDRTCTFPGCRTPAHRCDQDHRAPFDPRRPADQQTTAENLDARCKHHHEQKTSGGWTVRRIPGSGASEWTDPWGITFTRLAVPITLTAAVLEHLRGPCHPPGTSATDSGDASDPHRGGGYPDEPPF